MQDILTCSQMQQCDRNTMDYFGVISPVLMERAALRVAERIEELVSDKDAGILILCGTGNNGGDGLAAARLLYLDGYRVACVYPGKEEKASVEGKRQLEIVRKYGIAVSADLPAGRWGMIVDALFGIGLSRPVGGVYYDLIDACNRIEACKLAVDIPSGIDTDTGQVLGIGFQADETVTFGFAKVGQLLYPGAGYCGNLRVAQMGIDEKSLLSIRPQIHRLTDADFKSLPSRRPDANKGTNKKIALFAGSVNMAGAAILAAKACYAAGAGLVRVITPAENRIILQTAVPEAVLSVWEKPEDIPGLVKLAFDWADGVAAGPGLSTGDDARLLVAEILKAHADSRVPLALDADALNLIAEDEAQKEQLKDCVLTPHLGEMGRLTECSVSELSQDTVSVALAFAKRYNTIVIQKDARTVIASPDGEAYVNCSGNDGMAVGGSGDVLCGILITILAQAPFSEQCEGGRAFYPALAAYLHGCAGDVAAGLKGRHGMTAQDLIPALAECLKRIEENECI